MARQTAYLIRHISALFFSIYLPIFFIASLTFFVRVAKVTEVTQMSFGEMMTLYGYFIPTILFYTLPIALFAATTLSLVKLSNDYELIVLFSFGTSPSSLLRTLLPLALLSTGVLLSISLALVPITKQLIKSFISYKSIHAVIHIEPSRFGQKFGPWLVFLTDKDPKTNQLKQITLYNPTNPKEEQLLSAKTATFLNEKGQLGLLLQNGITYRIRSDKITQVHFKTMKIYDTSFHQSFTYRNISHYWLRAKHDPKRRKDLLLSIAVSLFPLITLSFALLFGIIHPRYDRSYAYSAIAGVTILYYVLLLAGAKHSASLSLALMALFGILGHYLFYRYIEDRF